LATATSVPANVDGPLVVDEHHVWPAPITGASAWVGVKLRGRCDRMVVKVYTPAMVCVGQAEAAGLPSGWSQVPLPAALLGAANGLYYYELEVERGGQKATARSLGRLMLLR
jgi:hypothetical protein